MPNKNRKVSAQRFHQEWSAMHDQDKMQLFSDVFTFAASHIAFRDRCLASPVSAQAAIEEQFDIGFPKDFCIQFVSQRDADDTTNMVILKVENYLGENTNPPPIAANRTNVLCTYAHWRSARKKRSAPQGGNKKR
jgi:hypothetical protein